MASTCNLSYFGSWGRGIMSLKSAWAAQHSNKAAVELLLTERHMICGSAPKNCTSRIPCSLLFNLVLFHITFCLQTLKCWSTECRFFSNLLIILPIWIVLNHLLFFFFVILGFSFHYFWYRFLLCAPGWPWTLEFSHPDECWDYRQAWPYLA